MALAVVVGAIAGLPLLNGGFLADDFAYIQRFQAMPWAAGLQLFVREWSDGLWGFPLKELRPFAAFSFMIEARAWGDLAWGYRAISLIWYLAAVTLVVQLTWRVSRGSAAAALGAGVVFALHPAHVEAVAWILGRPDLMGTTMALAFLLAADRFSETGRSASLVGACTALVVGVFTKEFVLTAPGLLLLWWATLERAAPWVIWRRRLIALAGALFVIGVYAACRWTAFGADAASGHGNWNDSGAWARQVSYLGWLVPVLPLSKTGELTAGMGAGALRGLWLALAGLVLLGLAVSLARGWQRATRLLFFGGIWWLVTVGALLVVHYFSPRHLLFPTVGVAVAAGLAVGLLAPRWRRVAMGGVLMWFGSGWLLIASDWHRAGTISREAHAALRTQLQEAPPGAMLLLSVPERHRQAWLWAWASPALAQPPFVPKAWVPAAVAERPGNYYRPDDWLSARASVTDGALAAAPAVVVLHVNDAGAVRVRRLEADELLGIRQLFAELVAGGLTPERWTEFVMASMLL